LSISQGKDIEFEVVEIVQGVSLFKGRITGQEAAGILDDQRASDNDLIPGVYEGEHACMDGSSRHDFPHA